ncbi:hypothetical protein KSP39_PZI012289 [Platanthera zijinensis]|uniref:Glycosyltransferase n=1 Tax=Platanthera zijinensis TaxID=2320716 RepID=A0AAP0BEL2_9ASPA
MTDLARLFAARPDVQPIMVVTPANADLIKPTLSRSAAAGIHVGVLLYPFPSAEAGLPPGKENLSSLTLDDEWRIYKAVDFSREAHRRVLQDHRPNAVIADVPYYWTTEFAAELGIPRVTFHVVGAFAQCVMQVLHRRPPLPEIGNSPFVVPEIPGSKPVELVRSELPGFLRSPDHLAEVWDRIRWAQLECFGAVVNTFYEFEPEFCEWYRERECSEGRGWYVGPLALSYVDDGGGAAERGGGEAAESWERCRRWLDEKEEGSVLFVCLGSWYSSGEEQLREMAVGLEESGRPFLWVVRGGGNGWSPADGWEDRVGARGLVVTGWAPQVAILNHRAISAFMSHCGWNSVMEAVAAGVSLLTWPLAFEQFINERLVTTVLGIGERVWDGFRSTMDKEKVVVPATTIASAVAGFFDSGGKGVSARQTAMECAKKAKAAVAVGGSSWKDLNHLIDALRAWRPAPDTGE